MNDLNDEKKQFTKQVREDYIDKVNQQIEYEEKARQYKFIFQLAEKYRQGDPKSIAEFIDSEKKIAEKDKNSIKTNFLTAKTANESITSRKNFIPMLELEYCILTTRNVPESLFPNISKNQYSGIEINEIDFSNSNEKDTETNIGKLFDVQFQENVIKLISNKIDNNIIQEISHAQVTVASLSFYPANWPYFLIKFKNVYKNNSAQRYSLLYFLSVWFEMRPKHFLKMFPYLIDLIEECDDGDLLIKHLKIIFNFSKRNMNFKFLPLDSVPQKFKLNYIQTSDYHKIISGNDVTTMQNAFKSNMLKRFDFTSSKLSGDTKNDTDTTKGKKGKPNDKKDIKPPNSNNNSNENTSANQTKNEDEYPTQPNMQDFVDAILILITTIQNALSLDCFIPLNVNDDNIRVKDDDPENVYTKLNSINIFTTKHLKDLFTPDEFNYWRDNIRIIEVGQQGIQKLKAILEGFSNWVVDVMNGQPLDRNPINIYTTIIKNYETIYNKVSEVDKYIAENFLKINLKGIQDNVKQYMEKQNLWSTIYKYEIKEDMAKIPECFLDKEQRTYKMGQNHNAQVSNEHKYFELLLITFNILQLLEMRPNLKNKVHMDPYSYESIKPISEQAPETNHNDLNQQYVDPWAIRTIFYNFTRYIFNEKYNDLKFNFQ